MSGRVVHFEVPFDDGDRARAFYEKAFGWDIALIPEMDYTLASTGPTSEEARPSEPGFINGGLMARSNTFQGPVLTLDVDDVEAALAKVEELGGKIVQPRQEVPGMGYTAYFNDPEGNLMGMWQNLPQATGPEE
ncbi:MAG: uncharacterized protein QOE58_2211 [Actinomycetota bacterium]|jgi:predicted enzyme related to lactoylglutathione lyase|nr:uncharacterized protein [Actinomycetota bacterium]